jgi:hypothetical protein
MTTPLPTTLSASNSSAWGQSPPPTSPAEDSTARVSAAAVGSLPPAQAEALPSHAPLSSVTTVLPTYKIVMTKQADGTFTPYALDIRNNQHFRYIKDREGRYVVDNVTYQAVANKVTKGLELFPYVPAPEQMAPIEASRMDQSSSASAPSEKLRVDYMAQPLDLYSLDMIVFLKECTQTEPDLSLQSQIERRERIEKRKNEFLDKYQNNPILKTLTIKIFEELQAAYNTFTKNSTPDPIGKHRKAWSQFQRSATKLQCRLYPRNKDQYEIRDFCRAQAHPDPNMAAEALNFFTQIVDKVAEQRDPWTPADPSIIDFIEAEGLKIVDNFTNIPGTARFSNQTLHRLRKMYSDLANNKITEEVFIDKVAQEMWVFLKAPISWPLERFESVIESASESVDKAWKTLLTLAPLIVKSSSRNSEFLLAAEKILSKDDFKVLKDLLKHAETNLAFKWDLLDLLAVLVSHSPLDRPIHAICKNDSLFNTLKVSDLKDLEPYMTFTGICRVIKAGLVPSEVEKALVRFFFSVLEKREDFAYKNRLRSCLMQFVDRNSAGQYVCHPKISALLPPRAYEEVEDQEDVDDLAAEMRTTLPFSRLYLRG